MLCENDVPGVEVLPTAGFDEVVIFLVYINNLHPNPCPNLTSPVGSRHLVARQNGIRVSFVGPNPASLKNSTSLLRLLGGMRFSCHGSFPSDMVV